MGRIRRSLVQKLLRSADTSAFELPKGWHVFSRYRTAELFLKHPAPPAVQFKDHKLHSQLLRDYPAAKLQPMRINSIQPSLTRRFVAKQHEIITQHEKQQLQQVEQEQPGHHTGLDMRVKEQIRKAAFLQVEEKMRSELQAAGRESTAGGYLEFIQQQEEESLRAALKKLQDQQQAAIS